MILLIDWLNQAGAVLLSFARPMLVQSSILILLLWTLDTVLRRRVRAIVRYGLWMLLLLKLVLPTSFAFPTAIGYWLRAPKTVAATPTAVFPATAVAAARAAPSWLLVSSPAPAEPAQRAAFSGPARPKLTLAGLLALFWMGGVLGLAVVLIRRARAAVRIVASARALDGRWLGLVAECCATAGVRPRVRVKQNETDCCPALFGLWRPTIFIPSPLLNRLSEEELRAVLLHELAHWKRRDLFVNYVQCLLQIAYFYHPLLWLANAAIRRVREEAVDEMVLVWLGRAAEVYPLALVQVARLGMGRSPLMMPSVGILEGKYALKQRVERILNRPVPTSTRIGLTATLAWLLLGGLVLPMAQGGNNHDEAAFTADGPRFNGQTREEWFDQYSFRDSIIAKNQVLAMAAIQEAGAAALPLLRQKLAATMPGSDGLPAEEIRRKAAWMLRELGPAAEQAIPELVTALDDGESVASAAAQALGRIGPKAKSALPALLEAARFGNSSASEALAEIAPDDEMVLAMLRHLFNTARDDSLAQVRLNAALALGHLGKRARLAIPDLQAALDDPAVGNAASIAIRQIAPDGANLRGHGSESVTIQRPPRPNLPGLLSAAKAAEGWFGASQALAALAAGAGDGKRAGLLLPEELQDVLEVFRTALASTNAYIWGAAGQAAGQLGPDALPLLPHFLALLQNDDSENRANLLGGLFSIAPGDRRCLPVLVRCLDDWSPGVRNNAAVALRTFGPEASNAVPRLTALAETGDVWMRFNADQALWSIARRPPRVANLLAALREDRNGGWTARRIAEICEEVGPPVNEAAPALREMVADGEPDLRAKAKAALVRMGAPITIAPPQSSDVSVLPTRHVPLPANLTNIPVALGPWIKKVRSRDPEVKLDAAAHLAQMGPKASAAIPSLVSLLREPDSEIRSFVAGLLADVDPEGALVTAALAAALEDPNPGVRANALVSLRKIGPPARSVLAAVRNTLTDSDDFVRVEAAAALKGIEKSP
ncbi:MAG: M56 family metallopeptidase [Verrucomicrobiota bacterium]